MYPVLNCNAGQFGQPEVADQLLGGLENGFFIEAGAAEGVKLSNSLFFEMKRNWRGLLVEPSPNYFERLLQKRR